MEHDQRSRGRGRILKRVAALGEPRFGEAKKDQPENRRRILRCRQSGVSAQLIRRFPETLFESVGGSVFLRRCDPLHNEPLFRAILAIKWLCDKAF